MRRGVSLILLTHARTGIALSRYGWVWVYAPMWPGTSFWGYPFLDPRPEKWGGGSIPVSQYPPPPAGSIPVSSAKLSRARSRLYRSRFSQVKADIAGFFNFYRIDWCTSVCASNVRTIFSLELSGWLGFQVVHRSKLNVYNV